jgi:hypothetical protein
MGQYASQVEPTNQMNPPISGTTHILQQIHAPDHIVNQTDLLFHSLHTIVPKIVRMRLFLQGFDFTMAHIPGKDNVFADWLSREQGEANVGMLMLLMVRMLSMITRVCIRYRDKTSNYNRKNFKKSSRKKNRWMVGYLRFLEEIEKFQLRNNQQVKYLVPLIEDKLREIVMSEVSMNYGEMFPTRKTIYEMDVSYLTATVQLMIKPTSKSHFLALLAYSCKEYAVE